MHCICYGLLATLHKKVDKALRINFCSLHKWISRNEKRVQLAKHKKVELVLKLLQSQRMQFELNGNFCQVQQAWQVNEG